MSTQQPSDTRPNCNLNIAAAQRVRDFIPDADGRREIFDALFGDCDAWRRRNAAASGRRRSPKTTPKPTRPVHTGGCMVDAAPSREHVRGLVAQQMRLQTIADAAEVSPAALGILLQGHYKPGRPPQETIHAEVEARILAVEFVPPTPRSRAAVCAPCSTFEPEGYKVGRCAECGELTQVLSGKLIAHPTKQGDAQ